VDTVPVGVGRIGVDPVGVDCGVRVTRDGVLGAVAVESVNGSGPCAATGWRKTSPLDFVSLPPSPPHPATRSVAESAQAVAMVPVDMRTVCSRLKPGDSPLLSASPTWVTQPEAWDTESDDPPKRDDGRSTEA
jgi:hypothetical protein